MTEDIQTPQRDPTIATTEQLLREIRSAREIGERALEGGFAVIEAKLVGMDKQMDERFKAIATQFRERDTRAEQTATQGQAAIAKAEAGLTKQIDQIIALMNATTKATDEKNDDVKDRVAKIETSSVGRINTIEGRAEGHGETWGYLIGAVGIAAAIVSIFFAISGAP